MAVCVAGSSLFSAIWCSLARFEPPRDCWSRSRIRLITSRALVMPPRLAGVGCSRFTRACASSSSPELSLEDTWIRRLDPHGAALVHGRSSSEKSESDEWLSSSSSSSSLSASPSSAGFHSSSASSFPSPHHTRQSVKMRPYQAEKCIATHPQWIESRPCAHGPRAARSSPRCARLSCHWPLPASSSAASSRDV